MAKSINMKKFIQQQITHTTVVEPEPIRPIEYAYLTMMYRSSKRKELAEIARMRQQQKVKDSYDFYLLNIVFRGFLDSTLCDVRKLLWFDYEIKSTGHKGSIYFENSCSINGTSETTDLNLKVIWNEQDDTAKGNDSACLNYLGQILCEF